MDISGKDIMVIIYAVVGIGMVLALMFEIIRSHMNQRYRKRYLEIRSKLLSVGLYETMDLQLFRKSKWF